MADLNGKDFVAVVRLSDGADCTIAHPGETCEKVPAGKHGGTVSDALQKLLDSGLIIPAPPRPTGAMPAPAPAPSTAAAPIEAAAEEGAE